MKYAKMFLAQFGGSVGLCVGFSLLSLAEAIYFFRVPFYFQNRKKWSWRTNVKKNITWCFLNLNPPPRHSSCQSKNHYIWHRLHGVAAVDEDDHLVHQNKQMDQNSVRLWSDCTVWAARVITLWPGLISPEICVTTSVTNPSVSRYYSWQHAPLWPCHRDCHESLAPTSESSDISLCNVPACHSKYTSSITITRLLRLNREQNIPPSILAFMSEMGTELNWQRVFEC